MSEPVASRRMRLIESLRESTGGRDLAECASSLGVDDRTIRRDVAYLQELFDIIRGVDVRRGRVYAVTGGYAPGYFTRQLEHHREDKEAIARLVVDALTDDTAIAITAGSSTYFVACETRRAHVEEDRPKNLISFTNSLPVLMQLVTAGISTGVLGEVYNPDDCAFHSHDARSGFHASVAVVGASGVVPNPATGSLDLFSHRAEEAAFLKQLLAPVPEVYVVADGSKVGRRHPWGFTSTSMLAGKSVRLFTSRLPDEQRAAVDKLRESAPRVGIRFAYHEAPVCPATCISTEATSCAE